MAVGTAKSAFRKSISRVLRVKGQIYVSIGYSFMSNFRVDLIRLELATQSLERDERIRM